MAKWLESTSYTFFYGYKEYTTSNNKFWKSSDNSNLFWFPDLETLNKNMQKFLDWLVQGQWKICSVTPLTQSLAYMYSDHGVEGGIIKDKHAYSYSYNYSITPIVGFIVLAQKEIDISDTEYNERMIAMKKKSHLKDLEQKLDILNMEKDEQTPLPVIDEIKKFMSNKCEYMIGNKKFETREEAEAELNKLQQPRAEHLAAFEALNAEVQQLKAEVAAIEEKYGISDKHDAVELIY